MTGILLRQEIKALIKSRKVIWSIVIFLILYTTVFIVRVDDYNKRVQAYIEDISSSIYDLDNAFNYSMINLPAVNKPTLYSIFNEGETHKRGSVITVEPLTYVRNATDLSQVSNPFFKEPSNLDISFLITFFFSLFVLLITFDSINREKNESILRIIFTYPVKRSQYILKKMLGSLLFIGIVFLVPYILSAIYLIIAYTSEIDSGFIWFMIIYGLLTMLFLFVIALLGIMTSIVTKNPARSLIYSLSIWIILMIITPTLYDFASEFIFDNAKTSTQLNEKFASLLRTQTYFKDDLPSEINPEQCGHMAWNMGFEKDVAVIGVKETYDVHLRFNKYFHENIYPLIQEREQIRERQLRLDNESQNYQPYLLWFSPAEQFKYAANLTAMNSVPDYIRFLQDAVDLRNNLITLGEKDGWLFTKEYFCSQDTSFTIIGITEYCYLPEVKAKGKRLLGVAKWNERTVSEIQDRTPEKLNWLREDYYAKIVRDMNEAKKNHINTENLPHFVQRRLNPLVILSRIWINVVILGVLSLLLFFINERIFRKFDLR